MSARESLERIVKRRSAEDEEVRNEQRLADAALVRKAGCLCETLVDVGRGRGIVYHHERVSCGNLFFVVDSHDSRCPQAIAEAIEKGGEG